MIGGVGGPCLAEVAGCAECPAVGVGLVGAVAVVAHVEEQGAVGELCDGALVACLEGGYNLEALGESVIETLVVMVGETRRGRSSGGDGTHRVREVESASLGARQVIESVREVHGLTAKS